MTIEHHTTSPESEPTENFWYALKEGAANDAGFISVGRVAWYPGQMPNGFEIAPAAIEKVVTQMGYDGVVLGRLITKPNHEIGVGSISQGGEATAAKTRSRTQKKTAHQISETNLLQVYLDFDSLLATARAWAQSYGHSQQLKQEYAGHLLNEALRSELVKTAFAEMMSLVVKDLMGNFNVLTYYFLMIIYSKIFLSNRLPENEQTMINNLHIGGFPFMYGASLLNQAVVNALHTYRNEKQKPGFSEVIEAKKEDWRSQWGIKSEIILNLIIFSYFVSNSLLNETQMYPRLMSMARSGLMAGKTQLTHSQMLRASQDTKA